ncbi:hypothetical protein DV738_g3485, partial [Chaetothyriales sp. CBS 135597]
MALISSSTLVYAYAGALLTIAYFLLTAPLRLLTTAVFVILGEAMHIREASFQPSRARLEKGLPALSAQSTQLLAIIGVVLAGYAFVQLVFAAGLAVPDSLVLVKRAAGGKNRGEEMYALITAQAQFLNIALVQVAVSGGLCAWIYVQSQQTSGTRNTSTLDGEEIRGIGSESAAWSDVVSEDAPLEVADAAAEPLLTAAEEEVAVQPAAVGRVVTPAGWQMLRA